MKRLHVHVAVKSIESSIPFYSKMFGCEPTIVKSDYAKWQLEDPKVNFAISARGAPVGLNHLGIQVENDAELGEMKSRLDAIEGDIVEQVGTACCYAKSDKYWVNDPANIPWETFHTLDTIPVFNDTASAGCCVPELVAVKEPQSSCCTPSTASSKKSCC
ncbi:glyoxalase/bleomycin resistance/dioxygenase family protein [Polynucleobacter sp. MWH-Spelu-300-X4]|uniref:ArsI/CadI family heavy metal resistance metalloenzyme n=1 Tax=Polynucleobacter sp. MWH-Spelu-300-X4 TaxID=2689109 RepID=UPI001BFDDAE5|nr:ArsI/CadI family heavy metal resistance metalloenzyme [Polynucleobacter sp. MWH-Spelu-300-X4]QWD79228.1 glyoxalase/bleomycin resistance/dioxygenase family protein [Polynucleobacter sp. MWH-Spelu-300-X4]